MNIAITCGFPKSLHTIAILIMAKRKGYNIKLCLNVSIWNRKRIKYQLTHLGWQQAIKKLKKRTLINIRDIHPEIKYIKNYLIENNINFSTVKSACSSIKCDYKTVLNLNSKRAINLLRDYRIDLVIYSGGGIIRKQFLEIPKIGVLNAHGGPLPHFRGMNVGEWSMYHGIKPMVTTHFIDCGIDTGPIIERHKISITNSDKIEDIRGKGVVGNVKSILEALEIIKSRNFKTTLQHKNGGRQFFRMTPELLSITELRLQHWKLKEYDEKKFSF